MYSPSLQQLLVGAQLQQLHDSHQAQSRPIGAKHSSAVHRPYAVRLPRYLKRFA